MEKIRCSIALCTYNGEKYIKEQLDSIIKQIGNNDEIIISDDGSIDNTIDIVKSYNDKRIKIVYGPKKTVKDNFQNAISNCNGKYIFLSDQDDVWLDRKLNIVLESLKDYDLVVHDAYICDSKLSVIDNSFFKYRHSKSGIIKNIYKNSYIGCCMAFNNKYIDKLIPIPKNIYMHDQWIGLIYEKYGHVRFINEKLIKYRRHNLNVSSLKHGKILSMIINRFNVITNIIRR